MHLAAFTSDEKSLLSKLQNGLLPESEQESLLAFAENYPEPIVLRQVALIIYTSKVSDDFISRALGLKSDDVNISLLLSGKINAQMEHLFLNGSVFVLETLAMVCTLEETQLALLDKLPQAPAYLVMNPSFTNTLARKVSFDRKFASVLASVEGLEVDDLFSAFWVREYRPELFERRIKEFGVEPKVADVLSEVDSKVTLKDFIEAALTLS